MNDTPRGLEIQKQVVIYMEGSVGEFVKEATGEWKGWGGHPLIHMVVWPPTTTTSMSLCCFFFLPFYSLNPSNTDLECSFS